MKDFDLQTGIIETFKKDNETGKMVVHKSQDVEPYLNLNKEEINTGNSNFKGHFHKMASIPPIVLEMWIEEMKGMGYSNPNPLALEHRDFLKRKLNDSTWNFLRTKQGVI